MNVKCRPFTTFEESGACGKKTNNLIAVANGYFIITDIIVSPGNEQNFPVFFLPDCFSIFSPALPPGKDATDRSVALVLNSAISGLLPPFSQLQIYKEIEEDRAVLFGNEDGSVFGKDVDHEADFERFYELVEGAPVHMERDGGVGAG